MRESHQVQISISRVYTFVLIADTPEDAVATATKLAVDEPECRFYENVTAKIQRSTKDGKWLESTP